MRRLLHTAIALSLLCTPAVAQAIRVGRVPVRPQLGGGSVTLVATPGSISFALNKGSTAVGSSGISVQTTVSGVTLLSNIYLYAYFASTTALTEPGGATIPSSAVSGLCTTGTPTTYTAFTQAGPGASSSLLVWSGGAFLTLGTGSRTDVLQLRIDLSTLPQQPAGVYTGTLMLQSQVF